jgi:hypothetical protein
MFILKLQLFANTEKGLRIFVIKMEYQTAANFLSQQRVADALES